MRRFFWMILVLVIAIVAVVVLRAPRVPPVHDNEIAEPTSDEPTRDETPPDVAPKKATPLVLTDVYTSDEAAQAAYERRAREPLSSPPGEEAILREEPVELPESFVGLFEGLSADATIGDVTSSDDVPDESVTGLDAAEDAAESLDSTAYAVERVVEGFLRDAVEAGDVRGYVSALDRDFRYTEIGGTFDDPSDDRVFERAEYVRQVTRELFEQPRSARVWLSKPRDFELLRPDVADVTYDYDIQIEGSEGTRRLAGTGTFLVIRGGTTGETDAWRIVEWVDSPPRRAAGE